MNVLFLLLTSVSAGDAIHTAPPASGPIVSTPIPGGCGGGTVGGYGSGGCGAVSDSCGSDCCAKPGFCERLKARFRKSSACCEPACAAPTCAAPACATSSCDTSSCGSTCDSCCTKKPSFFARLRARKCKGDSCGSSCDSCPSTCDGCGAGYAGVAAQPGCTNCAPSFGAPASGAPVMGAPSMGAPAMGMPSHPVTPSEPGKSIEPIKKMPKDDGKVAPVAPAVAPVTPAGARIETEVKNPFELARRYEKRVSHAADFSRLTGQLSFVHADGGLWILRYASLAEEDRNGGSVILARDRMMNNYREGDLVTIEGQVISQKGSTRLGGPLYRVQAISLVDRPLK